ncbi:MAG: hemolysin family protein [Nitrospinales bacterium]
MDLTATLMLVTLCLVVEAFFSGSDIALISANRIKIQHKADQGDKACIQLTELLKVPDRIFTTISFGTNLAVVTSTVIFTTYMIRQFGEIGDVLTMLILSPIILLFAEIVPKIIFQQAADTLILSVVKPLHFFHKLFAPVVSFFALFSQPILKLVAGKTKSNGFTISRDHIRQIIQPESAAELDSTEKKMIHKIFNFGETPVEQCMVPLVQVYSIRDTATLEEAHKIANESGFSRLPVFHERVFNLIGILNTFDLLDKPSDNTPISELIRPALYVPPNKKTDDLLKLLQQRGLHMAIVVDEYGGCIGIVTIEDLLEEIVGEIEDEYDEPEKLYETYADGGYLIEGDRQIDTLNEYLNLNLPKGDYETLGGLVIDRLEKIPSPGDQVVVNDYRLTVKDAGKRKVNSIIVRKFSPTTREHPALSKKKTRPHKT